MRTQGLDSTLKTDAQRAPRAAAPSLLVYLYPPGARLGTTVSLSDSPLVLGRDDGCDLQVCHASVSRRHARLEWRAEGHEVIDLESTNGTFVNDAPVSRERLRQGDYLRLGCCIFRYLASNNIEAAFHEEIYRLTVLDGLTNLPNKRVLMEALDRELARTHRYHRPLSVVLFDIDHARALTDRWGQLAGDFAVREVAALVKSVTRPEELLARCGEEGFCLVLPETTREEAVGVCHRLCALVGTHPFRYEGQPVQLTLGMGVTSTTGVPPLTTPALLEQADINLFQARNRGRNQVVA